MLRMAQIWTVLSFDSSSVKAHGSYLKASQEVLAATDIMRIGLGANSERLRQVQNELHVSGEVPAQEVAMPVLPPIS